MHSAFRVEGREATCGSTASSTRYRCLRETQLYSLFYVICKRNPCNVSCFIAMFVYQSPNKQITITYITEQ